MYINFLYLFQLHQASIGLPKNLYACLFTTSSLVVLCTISIFCLVAVSIDRYWVKHKSKLEILAITRRNFDCFVLFSGDSTSAGVFSERTDENCNRSVQIDLLFRKKKRLKVFVYYIFSHNIVNILKILNQMHGTAPNQSLEGNKNNINFTDSEY